MSEYHGLAYLTHKINHHRICSLQPVFLTLEGLLTPFEHLKEAREIPLAFLSLQMGKLRLREAVTGLRSWAN